MTKRLSKLFNWDDDVVHKMKQECKAKNERLFDPGLFKQFFIFDEKIDPSHWSFKGTNPQMAMEHGRYYRLVVSEIVQSSLPNRFWKDQVQSGEIVIAKMIFNKSDSDLAVITSELADLHLTSLGTTQVQRFSESQFSNPVSHFSELECFRRMEQNIEDDPLIKQKLMEMEKSLNCSNSWTARELSTQFQVPNSTLFRFNTGACLGYDWQAQQFCCEPVVNDTNKCVKHANDEVDLKLIRQIGSLVTKRGHSIARVSSKLI